MILDNDGEEKDNIKNMPENPDFDNSDRDEGYGAFGYRDDEKIKVSQTYSKRMLKKRSLERKMRKGNIWISRFRILIRLIIIAGLVYGLYLLVKSPKWIIDKDIFTTSNPKLEIINNKIVPTYKILNELRKIPVSNEPIYKFDTGKIRANLLELEPVDDIYIRRYWFPARLQIIVKERVPLISVYSDENSTMISFFTEDGVLIGGDYLPLQNSVETIKVLSNNGFRQWDKTKIDMIKSVCDYVEEVTTDRVNYVDMRNESDVFIKLNGIKLRVGTLDDGIYDRVSRIVGIIPQLNKITKSIDYIDLRWKSAAYIKTLN